MLSSAVGSVAVEMEQPAVKERAARPKVSPSGDERG